jgi:protein-tyrosine phosphatase
MSVKNFNGLFGKYLSITLAEGILASKLPATKFTVDCRNGDWHIGHAPDARSIAAAKKSQPRYF